MNFDRIEAILKAVEVSESAAFPLFFHSANGQKIAGAVLVSEEVAEAAIASIAAALHPAPAPTVPEGPKAQ